MKQEIFNNPKKFWKDLSKSVKWRDYILPKRTDEEFWEEGRLEAENILNLIKDENVCLDYVIEYGCGIGRITKNFKNTGKIIGLDICEDFIEKANDKEKFFTIDKFKEKNIADFIYSISVLQHNDKSNREKIVKNIHKLLKKGGKCLVSFPKKDSLYRTTWFVSTFEEKELKELFSKFSDVKIIEGNLVKYGGKNIKGFNELFVIATK